MENKKLLPESILSVSDTTKTREEDFGLMVVSRTAPAMCLNDDAIAIWDLCNGKNSLQEITEKLTQGFDAAEKEIVSQKIFAVIQTLLNLNLLSETH